MTLLPLERKQTAALYLPVMGTFPFPWWPARGLAFLTLWFESKPHTKAKEKSWSIELVLIFSFYCLFSLISISTSTDVTAKHQCARSWGERKGEEQGPGVWNKVNLILGLLAGRVTTEQWQRAGATRLEMLGVCRRTGTSPGGLILELSPTDLMRTTTTALRNTWARPKGIFKYLLRWF